MLAKNYKKDPGLKDKMKEIIDYSKNEILPVASVIIVSYNPNKKVLKQCLTSLKEQTFKDFEIIIVDNSDKKDLKSVVSVYNCKYIKLKKKRGPSLARNIGIIHAQGDIVIFLDDDAIPARNFVEEHIHAHQKYDIVGLRGKSLPRTSAVYNYLAPHYDLGDKPRPYYINLEGNSSFKRDLLKRVGCFNYSLLPWGVEGLELSYRIVNHFKDKSKLLYYPNAVIYHDFSDTFVKYVKKRLRHAKYWDMLKCQFPDIYEFAESYNFGSKKMMNNSLNLIIRIRLKVIREFSSFILKAQKLTRKFCRRTL